jgi:teichoic acid transport system permease protein
MATTIPPRRTVTVYEPTVTGLPPMRSYLQGLWDRRVFMWHMARTDLKAQHYDTAGGAIWLVVDPLLMAATFYVVRIVLGGQVAANQRAFVIANLIMGVTFFYFVRDIVQGGASSIVRNTQMVLNTAAPRAVYPCVAVIRAVAELAPALLVYLLFHQILGQPWGMSLLALPLIAVLLALFSFGIGLLMAPLVVFYRDTGTLLPYMLRIWMYVTPVMFTVIDIAKLSPGIRTLFMLNPLYPYFAMLEQIFSARWPSPGYLLVATAWAFGAMLVGGVSFLIRERAYAIRL